MVTSGCGSSRRSQSPRLGRLAAFAFAASAFAAVPADAQTLTETLVSTYMTNPQLNGARAQVRSVDEGVPQALSGNRPTVDGVISGGTSGTLVYGGSPHTVTSVNRLTGQVSRKFFPGGKGYLRTYPLSIGVQLTQPIFDGFQTPNRVKQAEASVLAQREQLRNTEQSVLLSAATAFMDVIQAEALVELQQQNLQFLDEQVKAAKDRFQVGEGTNTDVAQAEASQAQAQAELNSAQANLSAARATYRQVTGLEARRLRLQPLGDRLRPKTLDNSLVLGQREHPAIQAATHNVDVAAFNVKVLEGQTLPQVGLTGSAERSYNWGTATSSNPRQADSASVALNVTIPLYQAGLPSSQVRQAKEDLGFARIQVDLNRDQVRSQIVTSWGNLDASEASIYAARTSVVANQLAVNGVIEEQKVGQATTLDVLLQQSNLIDARTILVQAEHDRVVALYSLIFSIGKLDATNLNLPVKTYKPVEHYQAVRDSWGGLRTPDGR
jgi:outer membrane protein